MLINSQVQEGEYSITVARIKQLQDLLGQADKRLVNKFIDEVRAHVLTFHSFQFEMAGDSRKQQLQLFFHELNNKAHQLSRFTLELSQLVKVAPQELFTEAKRADRAIDSIHGNLVNLCLSIDDMILRKKEFVVDATSTVQVVYDTYARIFNVTPSGKSFIDQVHVPPNQPLEDLLVPVLEVLMAKDHLRCHNLVLKIIENKGNARL